VTERRPGKRGMYLKKKVTEQPLLVYAIFPLLVQKKPSHKSSRNQKNTRSAEQFGPLRQSMADRKTSVRSRKQAELRATRM
jgi:hypothetical protein